jgi:diguanylate cyclase (GGDEF)-like protein
MDIDQFKRLNDRLGHLQGDRCLRVVAQAIRNQLRGASDILARYGGEEFVLLLPGTDRAAAVAIAERIRTAVLELNHPHPAVDCGVVTISIGVSSAAERPVLVEDLLNQADEALYLAKRGGRNKVCTPAQKMPDAA